MSNQDKPSDFPPPELDLQLQEYETRKDKNQERIDQLREILEQYRRTR
jgi:hypothetical protein